MLALEAKVVLKKQRIVCTKRSLPLSLNQLVIPEVIVD